MLQTLEANREQLDALCRKYGVRTLEVFGSASTDDFDERKSDIDFLVDFLPAPAANAADQYFGLLEDLEALFGRDVDLVMVGALNNRYFIESVNRTRRSVYAA